MLTHFRKVTLFTFALPMFLATACAEPESDSDDPSSLALGEDDAGRKDGPTKDAGGAPKSPKTTDASAPKDDEGSEDGGSSTGNTGGPQADPVTEMKLDDDSDDAAGPFSIDPITVVKSGQWVRVTLPVTNLCPTWGIQGGGEVAATVVVTDETGANGKVSRRFMWRPSTIAAYNMRFVAGTGSNECSYSGTLFVN